MHPVSHLKCQLIAAAHQSRVVEFACKHVTPKENVLALCCAEGCQATRFDFSFKARSDPGQATNLFRTLMNVVGACSLKSTASTPWWCGLRGTFPAKRSCRLP